MKTETYAVSIEGTRPLLMHKATPEALGGGGGDGGRKRQKIEPPEVQAEAGCYRTENGEFCVPHFNVLSTIRGAAVEHKAAGKGKKTLKNYIWAGVEVEPTEILLLTPEGKKPSAYEIDVRRVCMKGSGGSVPRARPRFDRWRLDFNLTIIDPIITGNALKDVLVDAGKYVGLCDFRPLFGKFEVKEFEKA